MKKKDFALGILCGAILFSGATAVAAGITAEPTWQNIYANILFDRRNYLKQRQLLTLDYRYQNILSFRNGKLTENGEEYS